jgi:regulator of sirC expression with transglutaminase-like and TPR domain
MSAAAALHARWSTGAHDHALFAVEGMPCAGCARGIEAAVRALPSIEAVNVNVASARVSVDWLGGGPTTLQKILDATFGGGVRLREHHLRSFGPREILARELAQLKAAYLAQHDLPRAAASIDRLLILVDRYPYEVKDRAAVAMQMHAYRQAIELFERYLALMPSAEDRSRVREQIGYLRAWLDQN